jgi:IS5 family transposase
MEEIIDGVQGELGSTIPAKTRGALDTFRKRLEQNLGGRRRKRFEQELEAFLQSKRGLRAATKRYLRKRMRTVIKATIATLKRARRQLAQRKRPRGYSD